MNTSMSVEEKKRERSKAKQQVTTASRKLTSAVSREESFETLKALMIELDNNYDTFCEINEEYETIVLDHEKEKHRVVNGEDIPTYRANVMKSYEEARNIFVQAKTNFHQVTEAQTYLVERSMMQTQASSVLPVSTAISSVMSPVQSTSVSSSDASVSHSTNLPVTVTTSPAGPVTSLPQWSPNEVLHGGMLSIHPPTSNPIYSQSTMPMFTQPMTAPTAQVSNVTTNLGFSTYLSGYGTSVPEVNFPYPHLPHSTWSSGQNYPPRFTPSTNSYVQLKKLSLPTFSGLRKDWPEFKTVWKQLAESAYTNKTALAHELKRSVKGEASQRIRSVYVTRPEAYETMWKKLKAYYDDTSATVQAALEDLQKLKPVAEGDYRALVEFVDVVESSYSQLEELNQLNTLTMRDVDFVNGLLPSHLKVEWIRKYHGMSELEKIQPFKSFMRFLEREREAVSRLAENQPKKKRTPDPPRGSDHRSKSSTNHGSSQNTRQFYQCAVHRKDSIKHSTSECKEFEKLPITGTGGKYEVLKQVKACFICFGDHMKQRCPNKKPCSSCGSEGHHLLLGQSTKEKETWNRSIIARLKPHDMPHRERALQFIPFSKRRCTVMERM